MARKHVPLAIAYDFDGTLAPGNMQEHAFLPAIGVKKDAFWRQVSTLSRENEADNILVYMGLMLEKAKAAQVKVRKADFEQKGRNLILFDGVEDWFSRINQYGRESGVSVEHFVISSGLREIVSGTSIASKFKMVFASSYWYDEHGVAKWPALALNYTTKTQYLFRINKGSLHVYEHDLINKFIPMEQRPVPFNNIVYIGDGATDVPCFRLVNSLGGHSIAVFQPHKKNARNVPDQLKQEGRVNFVAPADYRDGKSLDRIIKGIIDKLSSDNHLYSLA